MAVPGSAVLDVPGAVQAARELRGRVGQDGTGPLRCVLELAEGELDLRVVVARALPPGYSGFYLPRAGARPIVAVTGEHVVVRQRFTIAHEAGHHVLNHGAAPRVLPLAETPPSAVPAAAPVPTTTAPAAPRRSSDPRERAANAFAAELLCPADGAREFVDRHATARADGRPVVDFDLVVRMSCAFGISAHSVLTRLETAGIVTDPAVRAALQARVDAREHVPRYAALGLEVLRDELQLIHESGVLPRLPAGVGGDVVLAVTDPSRPAVPLPEPVRRLRELLGLESVPAA